MPREIKPYCQGDLDYLCGIHAIVNALYAVLPDLKERRAEQLFRELLQEVARRRKNPLQIAWRGMDPSLVRHLITFAADLIAKERSVTVDVSRPLQRKRVRLETLVQQLREHTAEGGVAVLAMRDKSSHWTVVVKVTRKKIRLFDSNGRKAIRLNKCSLEADKPVRIHAAATVFLRKVEER
jgi:hypothetical protein